MCCTSMTSRRDLTGSQVFLPQTVAQQSSTSDLSFFSLIDAEPAGLQRGKKKTKSQWRKWRDPVRARFEVVAIPDRCAEEEEEEEEEKLE